MSTMNYEILPKKGYGNLDFGITAEKVIEIKGEPDEVEDLEDNEGEYDTLVMNYWQHDFNAFFEGEGKSILTCVETSNKDSLLFGKKVFNLSDKELVDLMKDHGHELTDVEDETWGEKRLSFESALMDFYFENGKLVTINWGVNLLDVI